MASNEYKLSVVDGTELSLSLNAGLQGPSGPTGPAGAVGAVGPTGANGDGYSGVTSTTSTTIGTGSKVYSVSSTGAYAIGTRVRAASTASPIFFNEGVITAIVLNTSITFTADNINGSGTFADWKFSVAGSRGFTGPTGAAGAAGADALWNYTGEYSGGASYAIGDVATYDGETFYRTDSHGGNLGDTPVDGSPYWDLLAAKGEDGGGGGGDKLPLAGGAMDTDAVITLDVTPDVNDFSTDAEVAGWGFGVQQKEDGVNTGLYAYVEPDGFHAETITANSTHLSGDSLTFDNGSKLKKGTTIADGSGGIALKCSVDYELKWEAGRLYTMEPDGFTIRRVDRCRNIAPTATDDSTKGFVVGSLWVLDDGTSYECTAATATAAVWVAHLPFVNGDGLAFNTATNTLSCNSNVARRAGNQTFTGDNTFSGQVELTGQALTNGTSAVTRDLGDARYGATYVGIKEENVSSTNNTPIKLTSVTLPIGMYQIDCSIAATALSQPNGGFIFGLRADNPIRTSLFEIYGPESLTTANSVIASDSLTLSQRGGSSTSTTNKRQLMGVLEVLTNNTEVSIEFCQNTTNAVAATTRKRSYIIARKIA